MHFLILRWSGTSFKISGYFITVPIIIFKDLQMSILSTILYILNKKNVKRQLWVEFFYIYPKYPKTVSFNKLIALDLLILWIIQRDSTLWQ